MNENFFANYKKFVVEPQDEKRVGKEAFDPENYAAHYILTLSIYNSRLSSLRDAGKFEIDVEKSIKTVLEDFNQKQRNKYHLHLLELDKFKNYFILALSSKTKFEPGEENDRISFIVDKLLMNPFYIGQNWFNLIGDKGRVDRKLFCWSFKEYVTETSSSHLDKKEENEKEFLNQGRVRMGKVLLKRENVQKVVSKGISYDRR